jgi:hypothetical protein
MGVLLLAVGFVFGFIPGMFEPFSTQTGPNLVISDRSAAALTGDVLVDGVSNPGILNETCTGAFFAGDTMASCRFTSTDLNDELGVNTAVTINTTIQDGTSIREVDYDGGTLLEKGPVPPRKGDVTVSQRLVTIGNSSSRLYVRVW